MPTYDYKCRQCDSEFEKISPISDRDNVTCACGGEAFRRITFFGSVYAPTAGGMR